MKYWTLVLVAVAFPVHADLEAGEWEITARTALQGEPDGKAFTQQHCLTREQASDPGSLFGSRGTACEFLNKNDSGSNITFDVACATQPPVRGSGSVRYTAQTLEGDLELKLEGMVTRAHISGRRLGGC
jgi:hypothetical protein